MVSAQKKFLQQLGWGLGIFILFIALVDYPLIRKIKSASQKYLSNRQALEELYYRERLAKEVEKEYAKKQTDLVELENAFLEFGDMVGFIKDLEEIAQDTNNIIEIQTISPFDASKDEEQQFLGFRLKLTGNFLGLIRFFANLEDTPYPPYRLIEIGDVNILRLQKASLASHFDPRISEGDLETSIDIKVYIK